MNLAPVIWLANQGRSWHQWRRRLRVLVHRGVFLPTSAEHYFIKATNLSRQRELEITHVWCETEPPVHVLNPNRPLPARLRLDETFETWIGVAAIPDVPNVERLVRVALSNGKVVKSRLNKHVPPVGGVAGPGSH
jgi:cobalamin biosynthesis protein CbiG